MRPDGADHPRLPAPPPEPPFRADRFRAAVLHACWAADGPLALGRLHLALWRAERELQLRRGRPLAGATWRRHPAGPRAAALEAQLRELGREGLLARRPGAAGGGEDLLFALAPPGPGGLGAAAVAALGAALRAGRRDPGGAVWRAAALGDVLPHFTACAGVPGELAPADLAWAAAEAAAGTAGAPRLRGAAAARAGEAVAALLWHLRRDPALGASLPVAGSWFVHKQAGLAGAGLPEVCAVYRLELDELVPAALRLGPAPDDDEGEGGDEDGDGAPDGGDGP
jgi:hypothetical protein